MKIYIAGKITGDPDYYAKFWQVESELEKDGHIVLNPAELPEGLSRAEYMQICFQMLFAADKVVFLPDFIESKGAMLEYSLCRYIGKEMEFPIDIAAKTGETETWVKEN